MKLAIATAAALLAASSFAFAADNNSGNNDGKDKATTGSVTKDQDSGMDDAEACRNGTAGGAVCQEKGTKVDPM